MRVLVACIGNIFQGDDGFGCEVARTLAERRLSDDVRVVDFGTRGLDLTFALLDPPELTILVDAVSRGGQAGSLYTIEPTFETDIDHSPAALDAHCLDPLRALRAARAMGAPLRKILLVGCEPADLGGEEGKLGLTPFVSEAVARAAAIVEQLAALRN